MHEFTISDELRFLAAQCLAQAEGRHRDQEALFLARLAVLLELLGASGARGVAMIAFDQPFAPGSDDLRATIRLAATLIHDAAARLERRRLPGLGDAA